jgi:NADH:ubiquinone oxidoreductase subunit 6 (subunit J)
MSAIVFFIAATGAIAGALGVVVLRSPFYNVLSLVAHLLCLAALFLLLNAQFVAAAQVVVYVGAVMVLYLFVVAYVGGEDQPLVPPQGAGLHAVAALFCGALFVELCFAFLGSDVAAISSAGAHIDPPFGTPALIGRALLTKFLFPFEAASILLLVAAMGAVMLARRRRGLEGTEAFHADDVELRLPTYAGTMLEGAGGAMERPEPAAGATDREPVAGGAEHHRGGW